MRFFSKIFSGHEQNFEALLWHCNLAARTVANHILDGTDCIAVPLVGFGISVKVHVSSHVPGVIAAGEVFNRDAPSLGILPHSRLDEFRTCFHCD